MLSESRGSLSGRLMSAKMADFSIAAYIILAITFEDGSAPVQLGRVLLVLGALSELIVKPFTLNLVQAWQVSFVGFAALSTTWATSQSNAQANAQTLAINAVCVIAFAYLLQGEKDRLRLALLCFMVAPAVLMTRVAAQYGLLAFLGSRAADGTSANIVGMTAAFGFSLAYLGFTRRILATRILCGILLAVNLVVVLLSASRKALLIVALTVFIFSVLTETRGGTRLIRLGAALAFAFVGWWMIFNIGALYELVGQRIETMVNGFVGSGEVDSSTSTRMNLVADGMSWFELQPWLGHGGDNFRALMQIYRPRWVAYYAHNNFVELLVNFGVVGFILYYWMYARIMLRGFRRLGEQNGTQTMVLCLLVSLVVAEYGFVSYFDRVFVAFVALAWVVLCTDTIAGTESGRWGRASNRSASRGDEALSERGELPTER